MKSFANPDNDPRGPWTPRNILKHTPKLGKPVCWYYITSPTGHQILPPNEQWTWGVSFNLYEFLEEQNLLYWGPNNRYKFPKIKLFEGSELLEWLSRHSF